jgi:hypothetical protein
MEAKVTRSVKREGGRVLGGPILAAFSKPCPIVIDWRAHVRIGQLDPVLPERALRKTKPKV